MDHLDSGYTIESAVGPVHDLTKWTGRGKIGVGIAALVFGLGALVVSAFVWDSTWFFDKPSENIKDAVAEMNDAWRTHTTAMQAGVTLGAIFGLFCLMGASTQFTDAFRTDYFFRAGTGGLWLRLPDGFSWAHFGLVSKPLELELSWDDVAKIEVVQTKQFGAMSRNAGNISASMTIRTRSGETHDLTLDGLEAAAYLIHERMIEAQTGDSGQDAWPDAAVPAIGTGSWRTG